MPFHMCVMHHLYMLCKRIFVWLWYGFKLKKISRFQEISCKILSAFQNCVHNAVINCIPGPHYPGYSWVLAGTYPGIYRILCPCRPGTYLRPMRRDIFFKRTTSQLPCDVHICRDWPKVPVLWGEDLLRDLQEKCALRSGQYPGLYVGSHKVQNWTPGQIPSIPG